MTQRRQGGVRALADLATPMSVRVGATLGIADWVAAGHTTTDELSVACSANSSALDRLLRHWVWIGLLTRAHDGTHQLTELGDELRSDRSGSKRPWLDLDGGVGRGDLCFVELLHTIRTGEPAYERRYGRGFWADMAADNQLGASFDATMRRHVETDHRDLVSVFPWDEVGSVVDVGGGSGAVLEILLGAFAHLTGTLVDLPGSADRARSVFTAANLDNRTTVYEGSFFDSLPPGGDAYLLSAVLHDWDDESCAAILQRCADAAGPGGRVLILEACGEDGETVDPRMDLRMLAYTGGKERGVAELAALAHAAGLDLQGVRRGLHSGFIALLELRVR